MKKVYNESQLVELKDYSIKVIESISETIEKFNENYGENREVDKDLGVYVLIV